MIIVERIEHFFKSFFIEFFLIAQVAQGVLHESATFFFVQVATAVVIVVVPDLLNNSFDGFVLGCRVLPVVLGHEH